MKIVDRKTFLAMPKGTVFCKFPLRFDGDAKKDRLLFGIGAPSILGEAGGRDFYHIRLGEGMSPKEATDGVDLMEFLSEMQKNLGMEVPFEHWSGRDGLFQDDSVGFAIYSCDEVQEMIDILQEALRNGYSNNKETEREMTDRQATATAYAAATMRGIRSDVFCREDLYQYIRDAYEQGWADKESENQQSPLPL